MRKFLCLMGWHKHDLFWTQVGKRGLFYYYDIIEFHPCKHCGKEKLMDKTKFVLVPIDPTNEMLRQAFPEIPDHCINMGYVRDKYQKMISAAPQPPSEQPIEGLADALSRADLWQPMSNQVLSDYNLYIEAARRELARGG